MELLHFWVPITALDIWDGPGQIGMVVRYPYEIPTEKTI